MEEQLIKIYFGLYHPGQSYVWNNEKAFHALIEDIRDRENQIKGIACQETVSMFDRHYWFCRELKIRKDICPCERLVLEKQVLNSLASDYCRLFCCRETPFQLRYLVDNQALSCAVRPGVLNLDNGSKMFCDVLIDCDGYTIHNWGPRSIFILPGTLGRSTENTLSKVVSKFDRSVEMYRGSQNQCVDWINHCIASSVENYEVTEVK